MPRLPLAVRVAAGLAATAVDEVRGLPSTVASLPVTAVSQVLQNFMRAQQQITSLAIKGDEVLAFLSPAQEAPEWATFDEDEPGGSAFPVATPPARAARPGPRARATSAPSTSGRFALYSQVPEGADAPAPRRSRKKAAADVPPATLPGYDTMTLAQLRARLKGLSVTELEDLLLHEKASRARAPFLTMLSHRIASVRTQ